LTGKAIWYVESHLTEDVSLDAVAESVGVSRFHMSRAFTAATGMSLVAYARARRLSVAAKALSGGARDILTVALAAGYGSHEAFTRAFRQHFGQTPEQFRETPHPVNPDLKEPFLMHSSSTSTLAPPRIVSRDALLILGISRPCEIAGDPGIPAQWNQFSPCIGNLDGQVGKAAYGVICNSDDAGSYDYLCGVEVRQFPTEPSELTRLRIPPQTYAVFEHKQHVAEIAATWRAIWERGVSDAGCKAADGPAFERYGEQFDGKTGTGGFEIWVPIVPPQD
jgi:AraC family transcriptional regulator